MAGTEKKNEFGQDLEPSADQSSPPAAGAEHKDKSSRPKYPNHSPPVYRLPNTSQPGSRSSYTKYRRVKKP